MKKVRARPKPSRRSFPAGAPVLLWGGFALAVWAGLQAWHCHKGGVFSPILFSKGVLLLLGGCAVFHFSAPRGSFFLGSFPLAWLALSRFQWDLCAAQDPKPWFWALLFLASLAATFLFRDGKRSMMVLLPLWAVLTGFFRASFLLPLSFLTAFPGRFKRASWVRWGGAGGATLLFLLFQGWEGFDPDWFGLFDLLVGQGLGAFFLLGWLGLTAFPKKGTQRLAMMPLFWYLAGTILWPGSGEAASATLSLAGWVTVFYAGFGLESLRRDLLDPSWHGRAVWAAVGLALTGGVL